MQTSSRATESEGGPGTQDSPVQAPNKARTWRIWVGMVVCIGAVAASVAAVRGGGESAETVAPADVPRIENGKVVFSESFGKRVLLASEEVRSAALVPVVSAVGMVTFDPRHMARVGTRLRGVVRELHVFEGAQVTRGQKLAEITSPELAEAQAQITMLRAQLQAATRQAER